MPYDRHTTDEYNLCNISSAEIPPLQLSLVHWLHSLSDDQLASQRILRSEIDEVETYRRTTPDDHCHQQYTQIAAALRACGVTLHEYGKCTVHDIVDHREGDGVEIRIANNEPVVVDRVVIATGHAFDQPDAPEHGYFASPRPMQKLLPENGQFYNFEIGTLGASLSAFDVVSSLAHRHGAFPRRDGRLVYEPFPGAEGFRMVLHSAEGWLPHLQYEQREPFRTIYRHVDRGTLLSLRDEVGFLSLDVFVQRMSDEHTADDSFALMRMEMHDANRSLRKGIPIHWKETLDDLMYTLNFHYDWLPAEDHERYRWVITSFLMNVIAAMPLHSANVLLALHDAGRLELVPGRVSIKEQSGGRTLVAIETKGRVREHAYHMFVNCNGQGSLDVDAYPFQSRIVDGTASEAVAYFRCNTASDEIGASDADALVKRGGRMALRSGGVAIDGYYRLVGRDGVPNQRIQDIAAPHTTGVRPYSYGLQASEAAASIVIQSWSAELENGQPLLSQVNAVTDVYEEIAKPSERSASVSPLSGALQ